MYGGAARDHTLSCAQSGCVASGRTNSERPKAAAAHRNSSLDVVLCSTRRSDRPSGADRSLSRSTGARTLEHGCFRALCQPATWSTSVPPSHGRSIEFKASVRRREGRSCACACGNGWCGSQRNLSRVSATLNAGATTRRAPTRSHLSQLVHAASAAPETGSRAQFRSLGCLTSAIAHV